MSRTNRISQIEFEDAREIHNSLVSSSVTYMMLNFLGVSFLHTREDMSRMNWSQLKKLEEDLERISELYCRMFVIFDMEMRMMRETTYKIENPKNMVSAPEPEEKEDTHSSR